MDVPNWTKLEYHEYATEIYPPMSEAEFEELCHDMEQNGYDKKQPIIIFDDKILDGRNRHLAAKRTGKIPTFEEYKGNDPLTVVKQRNGTRRHMDTSQRAMAAAALNTFYHGGNRKYQDANLHLEKKSVDLAKDLNVSVRSVAAATKVIEEGTSELKSAVRDGTVAVSDAAAVVNEPPAKQRKAVQRVRSGKAKTAREAMGKRQGKNISDKAAARLAKQQSQGGGGSENLVDCPTCKGHGRITKAKAEALSRSAKFVPPTVEEVAAYMKDRSDGLDAEQFVAHYASNGWRVGKNPMKDWKQAVITWEKNSQEFRGNGKPRKSKAQEDADFIAGLPYVPEHQIKK